MLRIDKIKEIRFLIEIDASLKSGQNFCKSLK